MKAYEATRFVEQSFWACSHADHAHATEPMANACIRADAEPEPEPYDDGPEPDEAPAPKPVRKPAVKTAAKKKARRGV